MKNSGVKKILVVEDETTISDVCRRDLSGEGFEVDIAVDGKVAQHMIEEGKYDLCLIDSRTSKMNGKGLYQWLKEKHPQLAVGAIFTTGDELGGNTRFSLVFTTKEVGKETGLGLGIAHRIMTEHSGRIYVESELAKGATFIVELPISKE